VDLAAKFPYSWLSLPERGRVSTYVYPEREGAPPAITTTDLMFRLIIESPLPVTL